MSLVAVRCPICGGGIRENEQTGKRFCLYCGTEVEQKQDSSAASAFEAKFALVQHMEKLYTSGLKQFENVIESYEEAQPSDTSLSNIRLSDYWLSRARFFASGSLTEFRRKKGFLAEGIRKLVIKEYENLMEKGIHYYHGDKAVIEIEKIDKIDEINNIFDDGIRQRRAELEQRFQLVQQKEKNAQQKRKSIENFRSVKRDVSFTLPNTAHETFRDPETAIRWRVLVPDDGQGRALIITEYIHLTDLTYHFTDGFTLFQSSEAQINLRNWFNSKTIIGPTIREMALDYEFQDEHGNSIPRTSEKPGAGIEVDRGNETENSEGNIVVRTTNVLRGRTRPLPQRTGIPEPFILSTSEANQYFDGDTGPKGRQAKTHGNEYGYWRLRSPNRMADTHPQVRHAIMFPNGSIGNANATGAADHWGIRPALWVQR